MKDSVKRNVILLSDGTGETASHMMSAAMVQFPGEKVHFVRYKRIVTEEQIDAICDDAAVTKALVVYTIVTPNLRAALVRNARSKPVTTIDLLGPLLVGMAGFFGYAPKMIAGLLHDVNERYFRRIEAMEYTIAHDDGRDLTGLDQADLVILGVSRTSKTPLSIYLAHHGWKVCNIPLIPGAGVPEPVLGVDQKRVIALTIDAETLVTIRRARLQRLGHQRGSEYADFDKVVAELEEIHSLFKRHRLWTVFNVTGKAVEETATEIMRLMGARELTPPYAQD